MSDDYVPPTARIVLELVRSGVLIAVEVFGDEVCCTHGDPVPDGVACPSTGHGLCDKFGPHSVGSDCNRAEGFILRPSDAVMDAMRSLGICEWPDDAMGPECSPSWPFTTPEESPK